jgi:hypothetical protein
MGTLTGCLTKAKGVIHIDDQRAILARSQELRAGGMDTIAAAAQAVAEQRTTVQGLLAPAEKKFGVLNQTLPVKANQTDTESFKKWFGDSKIVDADGKPMVVYHGTADSFSYFDLDHPNRKDAGWLGTGIYLTTSSDVAHSYSELKAGAVGANVMPLYVRLENPYYATMQDKQRLMLNGKEKGRLSADAWTKELKEKGHDGVILEYKAEDVGHANVSKEIVVFDTTQVKSAIGNTGKFSRTNDNILRQTAFYSALERGVTQLNINAAPASGWLQAIKGLVAKGQVKQAEIEAVGLPEFLELQKGKVTKQQVTDFLKNNGFQLIETVLGGENVASRRLQDWLSNNRVDHPTTQEGWIALSDRLMSDAQHAQSNGRDFVSKVLFELSEEAERIAEGLSSAITHDEGGVTVTEHTTSPVRFSRWNPFKTGENPREFAISLPERGGVKYTVDNVKPIYSESEDPAANRTDLFWYFKTPDNVLQIPKSKFAIESDAINYVVHEKQPEAPSALNYKVPPAHQMGGAADINRIVHIRVWDRLDAEGNKTLLVGEIQSDWSYQGKKQGFKNTESKRQSAEVELEMERVNDDKSLTADERVSKMRELVAKRDALDVQAAGRIPFSPFVSKNEAWLNIGLKKVFKLAADGGYEKVAFANGQQSADVYDLSKQVDSIKWRPNGVGGGRTVNVEIPSHGVAEILVNENGNIVGTRGAGNAFANSEGKSLDEAVGKDIAEKIMSDATGDLSGQGLKIGGEGLKNLYDKIIPNAVKGLLKKLGGDGLTTVPIEDRSNFAPGGYLGYENGEHVYDFESRKAATTWADAGPELGFQRSIKSAKVVDQPGFVITDKMRDIVAGGLPLFQGQEEVLGGFHPPSLTITLEAKANLSTLHHEFSHFFFEVMFDIASQENAPAGIVADANTVLKWFGIKEMATWTSMTLQEQKPYHERWAESYEQYLMEGKAPSVELQPLFWRFKAWMLDIYKNVEGILRQSKGDTRIQLSDEVRQVYDRLLASEEQIKQAEEIAGMMPDETATNTAIDKLTAQMLKNLKWLSGAQSKLLRAKQREAAGYRKDIRIAVMAEVDAMPVFQAKDELERAQTEFELHPTAAEFNAQIIADKHGFSSIDHMYKAIEQAGSKIDMVKNMTDARMLQEHGELLDPKALQEAVNLSIHNEAREKVIAAELKAEMEALSATTETGQVNKAGKKITVNALAKAARLFAQTIVNRAKIGDLQKLSNNHTMAERRAAKRWYTVKDTKDRIQAKQDQMLNNSASKALIEANAQVEKYLKYLKKFDNEGTRQGLHIDYLDQIDKLLERVDLRKSTSGSEIERRQKLAAWIKSQEDIGISPELPDYLLEDVKLTSYKEMTVEQFNGLVDSVRMIEHLGRLKNKLLTAKDNRDFQAIKESMIESILKYAGDREAVARTPRPGIESGIQGVKDFGAIHIKAATFARILDGGQDGGQVWEYLIRPANVSASNEVTWRSEATEALTKIIGPWINRNRGGRIGDFIKSVYDSGKFYPSLKTSLTRTEVLVMALNIGNEGNLQRLLGGKGWTVDQIRPVLDTLTAEDWKTVQGVWDYLESRVGGISEMERRVFGKNLPKVEIGSTLAEHYGLKGGYYPISYDPVASIRSQEHADAEGARAEMRGAYGAAQVRKGFTKPRADEVKGRPLLLDLSGLFNGVNDQIHYQAWTEWLIDANRLLRSQSLDASMREHYGPALVSQLKSWRTDIANGNRDYNIAGSQAASFIRHGISMAGLGFNVMSGASQIIGFNQSFDRVGARWMGTGIKQYMSNPVKATAHVKSMSEFMAGRTRTMFRELNELRNQVEGQTKLREFVAEYGYWIMAQMQQTVDVPTWIGAYEKAMSEGNVEERSIRLADQAVIDAQGSGLMSDLSAIERGNAWKKLFTTFYSFMNTALNLGVADAYTSEASLKGRAKVSARMLLLYTVPAVIGVLMKAALTPGDSGDDDPEKLLRKLASAQIEYLMGLMVFIREFRDLANVMTGADSPRAYQGPGGTRLIGDVGKAAIQAKQGEFDTAFRKAFVNITGDLFGLPSAQINRMWTGAEALQEGKTENPAALIMGYQEP